MMICTIPMNRNQHLPQQAPAPAPALALALAAVPALAPVPAAAPPALALQPQLAPPQRTPPRTLTYALAEIRPKFQPHLCIKAELKLSYYLSPLNSCSVARPTNPALATACCSCHTHFPCQDGCQGLRKCNIKRVMYGHFRT